MRIETLLKLQEKGKLPVDIRSDLGINETIIAANSTIALAKNAGFFVASSLVDYELAPETIHIEAYCHIYSDGGLSISCNKQSPETTVKTIDLSRDVEKDWT